MRVLITRAENEAANLGYLLNEAGLKPMTAPMMEIKIIDTPFDVSAFQGVITTSGNAVRSLAESTDIRDIPVYCIGGQSDKLAKELGFTNTHYSIGNHKNLTIFIKRMVDPEAGVLLYMHGDVVEGNPITDLRQRGFRTQGRLSYQTKPVESLPDEIVEAFESDAPPEIVTFFSIRTYRLFKELLVKHGFAAKMKDVHAVCLSQAIADFAREIRWKSVSAAPELNAKSVVSVIEGLKSEA